MLKNYVKNIIKFKNNDKKAIKNNMWINFDFLHTFIFKYDFSLSHEKRNRISSYKHRISIKILQSVLGFTKSITLELGFFKLCF